METGRIKKVMIALDNSPTAQKVAEIGFSLAKSMSAEVILLHTITDPTIYPSTGYYPLAYSDSKKEMNSTLSGDIGVMRKKAIDFLDSSKAHLGDESIHTLLKVGDSAEIILNTAKALKVDVIVMGSHSQKWLENILVGSVTEKVLRQTSIPLFIVPTKKNII